MDHVLIDMASRRMLGRGYRPELEAARDRLTGNEHIVYCAEAKGFAVYEHAQLNELWLTAKGWTHTPLVDYVTMCRAMKAESEQVGPIGRFLSTIGENDMSQENERNGVKWPQRGASARVFEIAQEISTRKQDFATKEEVVSAARAESINDGTASTQYSAWRRYWADPSTAAAQPPAAPVAPVAPQAPVAPPNIVHHVAETVHQAQQPAAFTPPAPPQFAAPAVAHPTQAPQPFQAPAPVQHSTPFQQPAQAQPAPLADRADPEQNVSVQVGFHVGVDMQPAIQKVERLLQLLKDAQADFGG